MKHSVVFLLALFSSTTALADSGVDTGMAGQWLFLVGFMVVFYFLLWRPQNKRAKEHQQLLSSLSKGDEVVTSGGLMGRITKLSDQFIRIEVAPSTELNVQRHSVAMMLPKGTMKSMD